jgi:hypothetical protein
MEKETGWNRKECVGRCLLWNRTTELEQGSKEQIEFWKNWAKNITTLITEIQY